MSRWATTASLATEAAPAAVWEKAYVHADSWPLWNKELKRATLEGPLAGLWRRILGPAAARSLPGAQQAIADLATA